MIEYLNEGLIIHTHIHYTLQRGKRVFSETPPEHPDCETWFEFEAYMYPPLMLLPLTWKRYTYTMDDVHATYEKMDASYVWQIALMLLCGTYEPEAASAGVRPTFQSPFTFLFISRKTVFEVFVSSQNHSIALHTPSVLCHERPDHKPMLPKVYVSHDVFNDALEHVPERPPSFCWCPLYPKKFAFKDIFLVPVEYDLAHQLVYMVRVVKKEMYDKMPVHPKPCVVTLPVVAHVEGVEYVLLEEACFFKISPVTTTPCPVVEVTSKGQDRSSVVLRQVTTGKVVSRVRRTRTAQSAVPGKPTVKKRRRG